VLWWLAGVFAALLAFLVISEAIGWRYLRGPVQNALARQLGVEVRVAEPFALRLLRPPRLDVGGLWVAAAPGSKVPFLVDASDLSLAWRWRDLWAFRQGEPLRIAALQARKLEAHVVRDKTGAASWKFPRRAGEPAKPDASFPIFGRLELRDGDIHIDDQPLALVLEARVRMNEGTAVSGADGAVPQRPSSAGFTLDAKGSFRGMPVLAAATSPAVLPLLAEGEAPPLKVTARATVGRAQLAYDGVLIDVLGERGVKGSFSVSGPSLGAVGEPLGVTLPTTPPFSLKGQITRTDPVWRVAVSSATVGRSRLRGEFAYDPQPAVPMLTGTLQGPLLSLADLAPAVGGGATDAKPARSGKVIPDRSFDLPSLRAMNADVKVTLDELDLDSSALEPFRPLAGRVVLKDGVLRIESLEARTAGGTVTGSTGLDSNAEPPRWQADLRWHGVDLAGWLRGARKSDSTVTAKSAPSKLKRERSAARTGKEPVTAYFTGELQGEAKLTGQGSSTAQILGSLNGDARAVVRDGTVSHLAVELMGLDVAQGLGLLVKGDDSLPLNCAVVAVNARQGVLTPRVAVIDTHDSTVTIAGTADLKQERLDLRGVVKPKDFSLVAVRSPLLVTGSFAAPRASVEPGPIVTRVALSAALAALVGPLAAILPLIDTGEGKSDGCVALTAAERKRAGAPAPENKAASAR
jgi:uncharacterized protein involved in outer membrane biogenesis